MQIRFGARASGIHRAFPPKAKSPARDAFLAMLSGNYNGIGLADTLSKNTKNVMYTVKLVGSPDGDVVDVKVENRNTWRSHHVDPALLLEDLTHKNKHNLDARFAFVKRFNEVLLAVEADKDPPPAPPPVARPAPAYKGDFPCLMIIGPKVEDVVDHKGMLFQQRLVGGERITDPKAIKEMLLGTNTSTAKPAASSNGSTPGVLKAPNQVSTSSVNSNAVATPIIVIVGGAASGKKP